jgi:hypothetical protein
MQDTSPAAERRYFELLRAKSPLERLDATMKLCAAVRNLAEAGIRAQDPTLSEEGVRVELTRRLYGPDVAARLFRRA